MKKVLIAVACLLAGMLLAAAVLPMAGIDIWRYSFRDYDVTEPFDSVVVQGGPCDVGIYGSYDGSSSVYVREKRAIARISVEDGVLTVTRPQKAAWYEMFQERPYITVYLPETALGDLTVTTGSGDVDLSDGMVFQNAAVSTASGDVSIYAGVSGDLEVETSSGDIYVSDVSPRTVGLTSASGDVSVSGVVAGGAVAVTTASGDIDLWDCDGAGFDLTAASGDITAYFLTPKAFHADTDSGSVHTYGSDPDGGPVTAATASGDIWLEITEGY